MSKKIRLIIVIACFALFFCTTPYIILYSLGYNINFKTGKIMATGGIYVRANPSGTEVLVDSKINQKSSFFSNSIFIQDLTPKIHSVLVHKDGYIDYQKNIQVKEKEVAKIENITLFKNNISFNNIDNNVDYFLISPNYNSAFVVKTDNKITNLKIINLITPPITESTTVWPTKNVKILEAEWSNDMYKILIKTTTGYFIFKTPGIDNGVISPLPFLAESREINFNPQNSNELFFIKNKNLLSYSFPAETKAIEVPTKIILKNVLDYTISDNRIIWYSLNGIIYSTDISGITPQGQEDAVAYGPFTDNFKNFNSSKNYKLIATSKNIFFNYEDKLYFENSETVSFSGYLNKVNDLKISPDDQNTFYINDSEIWLDHSNYSYEQLNNKTPGKILLNKFYENISQAFWLNNNYLIFKADNKIKISEIDNRENINIIDLPGDYPNANIYFNPQDKRVYVLTGNTLIASDRLLP